MLNRSISDIVRRSFIIFCFLLLQLPARSAAQEIRDGQDDRYVPVTVPNGAKLPWRFVDGVKVFHLVVEEFQHEFAPGLVATVWGYNESLPGPVIEAVEGDRVRIYVTNRLPEPTTVHWHGVLLPSGMDGVSGLSQSPIPSGETYRYEFVLKQHGTQMYHSHFDEMLQGGVGATGLFVIHPKPPAPPVERDYAIMLGEWKIQPGTRRPDPNEMVEFNVLTFNGKVFPATQPLVAKTGDTVRIRIGNLSPMSHHPIHLHGYRFWITETDGGEIPVSARQPETTVLTPVGTTRTVEFQADAPGDWALHCHMSHHTMNQMGHGLPNLLGADLDRFDAKFGAIFPNSMTMGQTGMGGHAEHLAHGSKPENSIPMLGGEGPFGPIEMGGMFTVLKVRDLLPESGDAGWYDNPVGTVARPATTEELEHDLGIHSKKRAPHSKKPKEHQHHHGS